MKTFTTLLLLSLLYFLQQPITHAQTDIYGGEVYGSWKLEGSPFRIFENVAIPYDSALTIEPGVTIEFQGHFSIQVQGNLLAMGTATEEILFTVNDTTGFSDPNNTAGGWNGIRIIDTQPENDSTLFEYCVFEYGKAVSPVWHTNAGGAICITQFDKVRISNCLFKYNSAGGSESPAGGAIHLAWADIKISDSRFVHNRAHIGGAIQMHESDPVFTGNIFAFNLAMDGGAISVGSLSNPSFQGDSILSNQALQLGGGLMVWDRSAVSLHNVMIMENEAPWGGGLGLVGIKAQLEECLIRDNIAVNLGGGIAADFSHVSISNTLISSNSASMSGGIHAWNDTLEIMNSDIRNNNADYGGGLHADFSQVKILNSGFSGNLAINGGGIHTWDSDLDIRQTEFLGNRVSSEGGAAELNYSDTILFLRPFQVWIEGCQFIGNVADFRSAGMKIGQPASDTSYADVAIIRSLFMNNHADRIAGLRIAGGFDDFYVSGTRFSGNTTNLWNGGASFSGGCTGKVENAVFNENQGLQGDPGATGVSNGSFVHFINSTFFNNTAQRTGGLSVHRDGKASITNCIFWNNNPRQISVRGINEGNLAELYVNYCDIQYGMDSVEVDSLATLYWGEGNFIGDPLFSDPTNGDFRILNESPCIDAGTDVIQIEEVLLSAPSEDIEENRRPQYGSTLIDMGAYENQQVLNTEEYFYRLEFAFNAFPNPFSESIQLEFILPEPDIISLRIFTVYGQEIARIADCLLDRGIHHLSWNATGLKSGIYIISMQNRDHSTSRMVLRQ